MLLITGHKDIWHGCADILLENVPIFSTQEVRCEPNDSCEVKVCNLDTDKHQNIAQAIVHFFVANKGKVSASVLSIALTNDTVKFFLYDSKMTFYLKVQNFLRFIM